MASSRIMAEWKALKSVSPLDMGVEVAAVQAAREEPMTRRWSLALIHSGSKVSFCMVAARFMPVARTVG